MTITCILLSLKLCVVLEHRSVHRYLHNIVATVGSEYYIYSAEPVKTMEYFTLFKNKLTWVTLDDRLGKEHTVLRIVSVGLYLSPTRN